jgi:UDP-glucose 4-epimerase
MTERVLIVTGFTLQQKATVQLRQASPESNSGEFGIGDVIHFATQVCVIESVQNPRKYFRNKVPLSQTQAEDTRRIRYFVMRE